jgi:hypothetical protein
MIEGVKYKVLLYSGELYVEEDINEGTALQIKFSPLYDYVKDERLVADASSFLKDTKYSKEFYAEYVWPEADHIGELSYFEENETYPSSYVFSFINGNTNPFFEQIPKYIDNAFSVVDKIGDRTIVPFDAVMYYTVNYTDGFISGLVIFTKNNQRLQISNLTHDEYYKMINDYNESQL